MGKIVKYCANCEESFAEKFSFCPNCAAALTAYEMNPLAASQAAEPVKIEEPVKTVAPVSAPVIAEKKDDFKPQTAPQTANFSARTTGDILNVEDKPFEAPKSEPAAIQPKAVGGKNKPVTILPAAVATANVAPTSADDYSRTYKTNGGNGNSADQRDASNGNPAKKAVSAPVKPSSQTYSDGGYNITFVEEKNNGTRRGLLAGAFLLVLVTAVVGLVASLYTSDALVGSVGDDFALNSPIPLEAETPPEEEVPEPPKAKSKDDAGGGGGGGKEQELETSKGRLAPQTPEKPFIAPSVTITQVTKPAIPIQATTQGNAKIPPTNEPYGNPNSLSTIPSDGQGSGGGQGSGVGRGQGSGRGTGAGSGIGSGLGSGIGDGIGGGRGSGIDGDGEPPAIKAAGPTEAMKILSKPRPNYTDAARQAQTSGTVTLRVMFMANGSIGSITTVSGLPNGLTEQAIAAARQIKFDPQKKGGVAQSVTKQVQFNFTLY